MCGRTSFVAVAGLMACVEPGPVPLPPGAARQDLIYVLGSAREFAPRGTNAVYTLGEPLLAYAYGEGGGTDGLEPGPIPEPLVRPCPLPRTSSVWTLNLDEVRWSPSRGGIAEFPGWREGPSAPRTRLHVAQGCGDPGSTWSLSAEGCALTLTDDGPQGTRVRAGLVTEDGRAALRLFDPPTFGDACEPEAAIPPALAATACRPAGQACRLEVYSSSTALTVTPRPPNPSPPPESRQGEPARRPLPQGIAGLALVGERVWVARGRASTDFLTADCTYDARLVPLRTIDLTPAGVEVPLPADLLCVTELFHRPGAPGFFALARETRTATVACSATIGGPEAPPHPWALAHFDETGARLGTVGLGAPCSTFAVTSDVDLPGPLVLGLTRRRRAPLAAETTVLRVDTSSLAVSGPVLLSASPDTGIGVELAAILQPRPGVWWLFARGPDAFLELRDAPFPAPLSLNPRPDPTPGVAQAVTIPTGLVFQPEVGRIVGFQANEPSAPGLIWTPAPLGTAGQDFRPFRLTGQRLDLVAARPWGPRGTRPWTVLIGATQDGLRQTTLTLVEPLAEQARLRVRPEAAVLGQGPPHHRTAVDAQGRLYVALLWDDRVVRVDQP